MYSNPHKFSEMGKAGRYIFKIILQIDIRNKNIRLKIYWFYHVDWDSYI